MHTKNCGKFNNAKKKNCPVFLNWFVLQEHHALKAKSVEYRRAELTDNFDC